MWNSLKGKKGIKVCLTNLSRRLDTEVRGDCSYQILWLVRHLEEYLERWLGFARMENLTVAGTLRNDLFCVVLAATKIIGDKVAQLDPTVAFPREEWKHFCRCENDTEKVIPQRSGN